MDYRVLGVLHAIILEWVPFPFSQGSSQPRDQIQVSCIAGRFFTSWATREAQEYWSGYPIPSPADLPDPGIELGSPALQVDSLPTEVWGKPAWYTQYLWNIWMDNKRSLNNYQSSFSSCGFWGHMPEGIVLSESELSQDGSKDLPRGLEGLPGEVGVGCGLLWGQAHW